LERGYRRAVSVGMAMYEHDAVQKASAMAFWLFLGLVPLVGLLGWALARFAGSQVRDSIVASLFVVAPEPAQNMVEQQVRRLAERGDALAPFSFAGFLWVASGGLHTAMKAIQEAQTGRSRSWWINRLLAIGLVLALLLVVTIATMLMVAAMASARRTLAGGVVEEGWMHLVRAGALPTSLVVATLGAALFFRVSTPRIEGVPRRRVWPGAVATGLSWVAMSWGFSHYGQAIGRYPIFYGSLAAVALVLTWLWVSSLLLLMGSEVNLQLEGVRKTIAPPRLQFWRKRGAAGRRGVR
jgi:membrane protein